MKTTEQRFWEKVEWSSKTTCLQWVGAIGWNERNGKSKLPYGRFYYNEKTGMAHKYAYERVHGAVPEGLEVDHLCRNTLCVNVVHLEVVTPLENVRRAKSLIVTCPAGHPYDTTNTYTDTRGQRHCRRCHADSMRLWRESEGIPARAMATDTHCANGHSWADDNERFVRGKRVCRSCHNDAKRRWKAQRKLKKD